MARPLATHFFSEWNSLKTHQPKSEWISLPQNFQKVSALKILESEWVIFHSLILRKKGPIFYRKIYKNFLVRLEKNG